MAHLSADDVVPPLRHNLTFKDAPQGLGSSFLSVKNEETGEETFLRGFEYSLARMLDGRRTAKDLVSAATDVGIPVTLDDLEAFVKKMSDRHLVGDAAEAIAASPFASRERWAPQTRELFRLALRKGRAGNVDQALSALNVLLAEAPTVVEAHDLRHRLREQLRAGESQLPFRAVLAQTERNWRLDNSGSAAVALPAQPVTVGRDGLMVAAGASLAVALLALAAMIIPFPHQVNASAALVPVSSAKVIAPRAGPIDSVAVKAGQWVEKDAVLFTYDSKQELLELASAVGQLERLQGQLLNNVPNTPQARVTLDAYQVAEFELMWNRAELESARGKGGAELDAAEVAVNRALNAATAAQAEVTKLVPPAQLKALEQQREQVQLLQRRVTDAEIRAPQTGVISVLGVEPGKPVLAGARVAQIDDLRKLKAVATIDEADVRALATGLPVLVLAQGRAVSAEVTKVAGQQIEVLIDNGQRIFEPSLAQLQIRGRAVPLLP